MKVISVVGARPNFMKIGPFARAIRGHNHRHGHQIDHLLVHTGQHYDARMSEKFFAELGIPQPDINLEVGSGSHAEQVGRTMIEFEKVVRAENPDWVVVVGDVNATCACSITAKKEHIKLAHIEAGLRSGDMDMPEEINRLVTDRLADLLFTPDRLSSQNLRAEGVSSEKICLVGNIMIDTLEHERGKTQQLDVREVIERNSLADSSAEAASMGHSAEVGVVTLHRPSNVDHPEVLGPLIDFLVNEVTRDMQLVWPMHPRTQKQLRSFGLWEQVRSCQDLFLLHPIGYHDMLRLNMNSRVMLTDSGGLQEECCVLGTPCLTLRHNTERPVTLREHGGASTLVGNDVDRIRQAYRSALEAERKPVCPELWDGRTAERIVAQLIDAECEDAQRAMAHVAG